ncbi:MAG: OadG family protein [Lachnospiraceae bacterium]|nr:OadG family protein [Lachnospiraceae bacterium]
MKKWLLVLGMITCMMGLTACSEKQANVENPMLTEADALGLGENVVETINLYVQQNAKDQITDAVLLSAVESWESAAEDMGDYIGIISTDSDITEDDGIIRVTVEGSTRNAVVELVLDAKKGITGISTNVEYTFKEKMGKAALNTLLGMGTVFVVLILISAIISCFNLIPGIQEKLSRKSKKAEVKESAPASSAPQAAVPVEEDLTDDLELVAVIAAAIAASEGAASTDGFVVRSIRRAGRRQRA